jgi:hypothetical protein
VPTLRKTETAQRKNLMLHLKFPPEKEQSKPQTSRQREITKIRAEINEIKNQTNYTKNQ